MNQESTNARPLDVALQGVNYLAQIIAQHDISIACMKIVGSGAGLSENFRVILHQRNQFQPDRVRQITLDLVEHIISKAHEVEKTKFQIQCRSTLVALCGGLEALVKDVVAALLVCNPGLIEQAKPSPVRLPAVSLLTMSLVDRARYLVDALYQEESSRLGYFTKFSSLLRIAEMEKATEVDESTRTVINEAYEVRNVIVHRGGKIDYQLKSKCPALPQDIGELVNPGQSGVEIYSKAIMELAENIVKAHIL